MVRIESFPPIENPEVRLLILGSIPGQLSLEMQQYYAHPRNSFWFIMGELLGFTATILYEDRLKILLRNRIALWDVINSCTRSGSLDSNIDEPSLLPNDLKGFIRGHRMLKAVFFNGGKAEQAYCRHILPVLGHEGKELRYHRLPSTSPAHAGMSREQKLVEWRMIREYASEIVQD
jgi:hypoxanthine-DNA glycosylase